jgi:hypothetical protein
VHRQEEKEGREMIDFDDILRAAAIMDGAALSGDYAVQCTDPSGMQSMVFVGTQDECEAFIDEVAKEGDAA